MERKQPKNTDSSSPDQWEIIPNTDTLIFDHPHIWRLVRLRNPDGLRRTGLWCEGCGKIEVLSERQLRTHGQQRWRSEKR